MPSAQYNASTLKAHYDAGTGKAMIALPPGPGEHEFATDDCCCFLDPTIPEWSPLIYYPVEYIVKRTPTTDCWKCIQPHINQTPSEGAYWTKKSGSIPCGNSDWDRYWPYGGFGLTPKYYTVTARRCDTQNLHCFESGWNPDNGYPVDPGSAESCNWSLIFDGFRCDGTLSGIQSSVSVGLNYTGPLSADPATLITFVVGGVPNIWIEPPCKIAGTAINLHKHFIPPHGHGFVSWYPGKIDVWKDDQEYEPTNVVTWKGVFYYCILEHTNQEPPNSTYWKVLVL